MRDNLVRCNMVLTKVLRKCMQDEANKKYGGNMSLLIKIILAERYKKPAEVPEEFRK